MPSRIKNRNEIQAGGETIQRMDCKISDVRETPFPNFSYIRFNRCEYLLFLGDCTQLQLLGVQLYFSTANHAWNSPQKDNCSNPTKEARVLFYGARVLLVSVRRGYRSNCTSETTINGKSLWGNFVSLSVNPDRTIGPVIRDPCSMPDTWQPCDILLGPLLNHSASTSTR